MIVQRLELRNFRNYRELGCDFDPQINVITGRNAQGKTNLLEAVYYLAGARSFRTRSDRDILHMEETEGAVTGFIASEVREQRIDIYLSRRERKKIFVGGVRMKSASELAGRFACTLFCPDDLELIKGGAAERRRFMDLAISQLRPKYADLLTNFNRIYEQKTRILRDYRDRQDMLDVLDEFSLNLAKYGSELMRYRASWCARAAQAAGDIHGEISGCGEKLRLDYRTVSAIEDPLEMSAREILDALLRQQERLRQAEIDAGQCLAGVQKDDIAIRIDGSEASKYASQGQIRTAALSMKLAEWTICRDELGSSPVLLLDDVLSELDAARQDYVLNSIQGGQVLITCCDEEEVSRRTGGSILRIEGGRVRN